MDLNENEVTVCQREREREATKMKLRGTFMASNAFLEEKKNTKISNKKTVRTIQLTLKQKQIKQTNL